MKQLQLDKMYLEITKTIANQSYAKRLQVGAIVVKDNSIVSYGFNGNLPTLENVCESVKEDGTMETLPTVCHAEMNSISKAAKSTVSIEGATMYCTHSACFECAKLVIQSGIKRFVYINDYRDERPIELLKKFITVERIDIS